MGDLVLFPSRDVREACREAAWDAAMAEVLAEYGPWCGDDLPLWAVEAWAGYVLNWRARFGVESPHDAPWPELWMFFARREGIQQRQDSDGGVA